MDRKEILARRKMLEGLVGPFDYDDPDYDDKRAFILFNAKDPNATWEDIISRAPDPELSERIRREGEARSAKLDAYIEAEMAYYPEEYDGPGE